MELSFEFGHPLEQIIALLSHTVHQNDNILKELHRMSTSAVTRDQFDAALTAAVTTIQTSISDLQAKIAAGTVVTPEDFSAELAKLQSLTATATSADPGAPAAPVTPDPSTPSTPTV